jgi:hypothetical protein
MLNDSLELAVAAVAAAEAGPVQGPAAARVAQDATKGLAASAYISAAPDTAGTALAMEQILQHRGWKTARDLKTLVCVDNPNGPITDPLTCESFVFAILGRGTETSRAQADEIERAKLLGKPIIPVVTADWEAMPKTATLLTGYAGVSMIDKSASEQNALIHELLDVIEKHVIAAPDATAS